MHRLLAIRWSVEEYFKKHAGDYDQPLEMSHWEALRRIKSVLEWPMGATMKLESKKVVTIGSPSKSSRSSSTGCEGSAEDKRRDMNQGLLCPFLMWCTANSVKNWKMMERFSWLHFHGLFRHWRWAPISFAIRSKSMDSAFQEILWISAHGNSIIAF